MAATAINTTASGGASTTATYVLKTADGGLPNALNLSALSTGLVKVTNGTGNLTTATEGSDYYKPGGTDVAVADGGTGVSTLTGIVKGNGTSAFSAASAGTDYYAPGGSSLAVTSGGNIGFASRSLLTSPADGNLLLTNNAGSAFTLLQLGGTSNAFPCFKRQTSSIQCRLADDSDFCNFQAKNIVANGAFTQNTAGSATFIASNSVTLSGVPTSDPESDGQLFNNGGLVCTGNFVASSARTAMGLTIGTDVLAPSGNGKSLTGLTRIVSILVSDPNGSAITTGDGKAYFRVPADLNGFNLVSVAASVDTVSSSGIPTIQIHRNRSGVAADMLSTKLTIDANENDSSTAATAAVIDTSNDDVNTADRIYIDIDVAGTGAKGLAVEMKFQQP